MKSELETLLKIIEIKLDWGDSTSWQSQDFENLHHLILEKTGVSLSSSTLRRVWGRVDYKHDPSFTTLNTLSLFADYENWRAFLKEQHELTIPQTAVSSSHDSPVMQQIKWKIPWVRILSVTGSVVLVALVFLLAFRKAPRRTKVSEYSFSSRPVSREIPNSVIFTYDATASDADSIFVQQSWDSRTLTPVAKEQHQHTSIYYEPGFYTAKLIAGREIVKEHPLLIPTRGWLGIIANKPVPVYLDSSAFIYKDCMRVAITEIKRSNILMEPQPPVIKYYNVGNFDTVAVDDFSFSTEVKNEYREGAAACQLSGIILVTDGGPVIIPLSIKGCVSELTLFCIDHPVSGKNTDLSAFGVDFANWVQVGCRSAGKKIQILINEKLAYEFALPQKKVHVVGMTYIFQGTGAVKNINLFNRNSLVFHAF